MIANPCRAPLVPGFYGTSEGYLTRTKSVFQPTFGAPSCGYMLWVPELTTGESLEKGNLFFWQSESTSVRPLNETFNPGATFISYGTQTHTASQYDTAQILDDPALDLNVSTARDVRAISACMRFNYFGRLDASAGQVAYIQGLPLSDLLGSDAKDASTDTNPMNVDELFKYATTVQRFGVDVVEVIHKPTTRTSGYFHTETDGAIDVNTGGFVSIVDEPARLRGLTCFGLAWRGTGELMAADGLAFEFYKNVEWRPRPALGVTHVPPRAVAAKSVDSMVRRIETISPNFAERVVSTAKSSVSHLLEGVYAGVEHNAKRAAKDIGFAAAGALLAV